MKIDKACKVEKCVSREKDESVTRHLFLEKQESGMFLCATNRRNLVKVAVQTDKSDVPGMIPVESLRAARKIAIKADDYATLSARTSQIIVENTLVSSEYTRDPELKFPVIKEDHLHGKVLFTACINAASLLQISQAMGTEILKLEFRDGKSPVVVRPADGGDDWGLMAAIEPAVPQTSDKQMEMV